MYPYYRTSPTAFVKGDYYCESGTTGLAVCANVYMSDPLRDGKFCSAGITGIVTVYKWKCQSYRKILEPSSENIEVRICINNHTVMKI